jgi:hypothetical protein
LPQGLSAILLEDLPAFFPEGLPAVCPEGLSAVFMAEVLGKSGRCEEECNPIIMRDADKALHFVFSGTI